MDTSCPPEQHPLCQQFRRVSRKQCALNPLRSCWLSWQEGASKMCRAITCSKCKRPSWAGCGAHVEQVLGHVPAAERCQCKAADAASGGGLGKALKSLFGR